MKCGVLTPVGLGCRGVWTSKPSLDGKIGFPPIVGVYYLVCSKQLVPQPK